MNTHREGTVDYTRGGFGTAGAQAAMVPQMQVQEQPFDEIRKCQMEAASTLSAVLHDLQRLHDALFGAIPTNSGPSTAQGGSPSILNELVMGSRLVAAQTHDVQRDLARIIEGMGLAGRVLHGDQAVRQR